MLLLALFLLCVGAYAEDYALVIDAGSTGSRAFVYRFSRDAETGTRTVIAVNVKKVLPGLSSFGANPQESVAYLRPLLLDAADVMDKEHHAKTKVYIKATAGMR
jgi:Golgi nucleoside diphosphatase